MLETRECYLQLLPLSSVIQVADLRAAITPAAKLREHTQCVPICARRKIKKIVYCKGILLHVTKFESIEHGFRDVSASNPSHSFPLTQLRFYGFEVS